MKRLLSMILGAAAALSAMPAISGDKLVVYSARKEHLIKPLFDQYTQKTGVEIEYITDKAAPLLARLKAEGSNTPADVLLTVDAGNLWHAGEEGLFDSLNSKILEQNIPANLRDPNGKWAGLSMRARTIVYNPAKVKDGELVSYEGLADPKWKGRLCLRTSKKVYNQSLVATLIERLGEAEAEKVVKGWVDNLAMPPFSNDTKSIEAVKAGRCDVTVVNTYYFGRLEKKVPDLGLKIFWPNQTISGVHVNVSGAGLVKHSKNKEAALALIEWLSGVDAQKQFAGLNLEFPVNKAVEADAAVKAWGEFKADPLNIAVAGQRQAQAVKLMDRAGYK